ncbi:MAG: hypothetical protein HY901_07715, partial [Deltaproteobacteria bacterium]|nr:hypothetical protein [Deltaproteobacteria bacterium]
QKRGCTIIFVSHSLESVQKICNRAILLSHGQIIADGPAMQVALEYADRVARKQLEAPLSPYEKERIPVWKRSAALLAIVAIVGTVAWMGATFVLAKEMPAQRPPVHRLLGQQPAPEPTAPSTSTGQR